MQEMRSLFSLIAILTLLACSFNVTPTFYVRDVQDVISDNQPIDIPIFLKIPASDAVSYTHLTLPTKRIV